MKSAEATIFENERPALIRLTALWALSEAGLGGLMHLLRTPFTGIFVGGAAVLLIAMIAHVAKRPGPAILRALVLVLIIKAAVSPHSPPTAYLAVGFQGLLGALLFSRLPSFRLAALLLGALGLLESALQKLLVLTVLFGMPLWESIDAFVDYVLQKFGLLPGGAGAQGSLWLIGLYVGLYLAGGLFIGWLAGRLPAEVKAAAQRLTLPAVQPLTTEGAKKTARRPFWRRPMMRWITAILLALLVIYLLAPGAREALAPLWLLVRVAGILAAWYFLAAPLLMGLLQRFLKKKASDYREEVDAALGLLPVFRYLARAAWIETRRQKGWRRWKELAVRLITYALLYSSGKPDDRTPNIIVFTAPVNAGKTTALMEWVKGKGNIGGFLAPDIDGRRRLYFLRSRQLHDFQLTETAAKKAAPGETVAIGRFFFDASAFALARQTLLEDSERGCRWVIIDEVGKLELQGKGLEPAAGEAVRKFMTGEAPGKLLLVVRNELVEKVAAYYGLEQYTVIRLGEALPA